MSVQVLLALQRLVNALGAESPSAYPLLIPVLQLCTDPNQVCCTCQKAICFVQCQRF